MTIHAVRTISVGIDRDWRAVYEFLSVPPNFPRWASGLGANLEAAGDEWLASGPDGPIRIRFAPPNPFGVVDHVVVATSGAQTLNPMRVMPNGTGCEVSFTLFQAPGMSDERFAGDAAWVARDLQTLKSLLEA